MHVAFAVLGVGMGQSFLLCCAVMCCAVLWCALQVVWGAGTGQLPEAPPGVACRIVSLDQVCTQWLRCMSVLCYIAQRALCVAAIVNWPAFIDNTSLCAE
jgi:hypothetical protein